MCEIMQGKTTGHMIIIIKI